MTAVLARYVAVRGTQVVAVDESYVAEMVTVVALAVLC